MRGCGGERVIRSLLSYPRYLSIKGILATIVYKIKQDVEEESYKSYLARCLRILTENTSVPAGYYSGGEKGAYITIDFDDIIKPKPQQEYKPGAIAEKIKAKMR